MHVHYEIATADVVVKSVVKLLRHIILTSKGPDHGGPGDGLLQRRQDDAVGDMVEACERAAIANKIPITLRISYAQRYNHDGEDGRTPGDDGQEKQSLGKQLEDVADDFGQHFVHARHVHREPIQYPAERNRLEETHWSGENGSQKLVVEHSRHTDTGVGTERQIGGEKEYRCSHADDNVPAKIPAEGLVVMSSVVRIRPCTEPERNTLATSVSELEHNARGNCTYISCLSSKAEEQGYD